MSTLAEIKDMSAYELSRMADCGDPDTLNSTGAEFLKDVRDAFAEAVEEGRYATEDPYDIASQLADACVPVYTHAMWAVFMDLCLWDVDIDDMGGITSMQQGAAMAIYLTAERLISVLHDDLDDSDGSESDDDDTEEN